MPLDNSHLQHLVATRRTNIVKREAADADVKKDNDQLMDALKANAVKRHQLVSGTVIQIVQPADRLTVSPEKLLELGVDPEIIAKATVNTPVKEFIRVDEPKVPKGTEVSVDTGLPVGQQPDPERPPTVN